MWAKVKSISKRVSFKADILYKTQTEIFASMVFALMDSTIKPILISTQTFN